MIDWITDSVNRHKFIRTKLKFSADKLIANTRPRINSLFYFKGANIGIKVNFNDLLNLSFIAS